MSQSVFSEVGRVLAIGDLHGNYAGFKRILQETGLIDKRGHWRARHTHLVQLGDILGRGGEPGKIFKLLKRLETEAAQFDSRVHVLLGNHEAMSMSGVMVYNTMEEFRDLVGEDLLQPGAELPDAPPDRQSKAGMDGKLSRRLDMLGCREFRAALSPKGKVGAWLAGHDSAVSVNGFLFVHGGLNRHYGFMPLHELNHRVRVELCDDGAGAGAGEDRMLRRDGPQWNREFTLKPDEHKRKELEGVLDFHRCAKMVVGHTPTSCIDPQKAGRILPMYGERLFCIDTGIGKTYGEKLSALNVERGLATALYF